MVINEEKLAGLLSDDTIEGRITVNDLREKLYLNPQSLTLDEQRAIQAFDTYRLAELKSSSEDAFHKVYLQLQVMANLMPFTEFLSPEYHKFSE